MLRFLRSYLNLEAARLKMTLSDLQLKKGKEPRPTTRTEIDTHGSHRPGRTARCSGMFGMSSGWELSGSPVG